MSNKKQQYRPPRPIRLTRKQRQARLFHARQVERIHQAALRAVAKSEPE